MHDPNFMRDKIVLAALLAKGNGGEEKEEEEEGEDVGEEAKETKQKHVEDTLAQATSPLQKPEEHRIQQAAEQEEEEEL